jgi:hypothetical protein
MLPEMMRNQTMNCRNSAVRFGGVARQIGGRQVVSSPKVDECGE